MEKRCDLHSHSRFSDGSMTPTEMVALAEQLGLSALALTDHNTSLGLKELMEAGRYSPVITVPGCEFSTEYRGKEVHMVGLFFPQETWQEIEDFVELMHMAKRHSNKKLIEALQQDGYPVTYQEAAALTGSEDFNRAHVARVLMAKGVVSSVKEAFQTLLKEGNGYYTPAKKLGTLATVRFIQNYGGVSVLAHPFLNFTEEELREFLPLAKTEGLVGMETHYTEFSPETTEKAISLAKEFGLKESGGSDFHGEAKPTIALGSGWGDLVVPFSFYENLRP